MQANQRRSLTLIEVTVHRVANLLVELVEVVRLGMNRLPNSAGTIRAILSRFDNKKNLVHDSSLACPFWQQMRVLVLSAAITSLGAAPRVAETVIDGHHRADEVHTGPLSGSSTKNVSPELLAFLQRPRIGALIDRDDERGDGTQDLEELGFGCFH